jgi:cytochrome c oxidase subunit I+III
VVTGIRTDEPEVLVTRLIDADPSHREASPGPTATPLITALGTGIAFIVGIFTPWGIPAGAVVVAVGLFFWFLPHPPHKELIPEQP